MEKLERQGHHVSLIKVFLPREKAKNSELPRAISQFFFTNSQFFFTNNTTTYHNFNRIHLMTFNLNVTTYKFLKVYIVDLVTFIRPFSSKIKNNTKTFCDIGFSDIPHKY